MRVLVACEFSGRVRDAFRRLSHDAWSCDLIESEASSAEQEYHYICDVREVLNLGWDLMIGHPPCTYLTNAGVRHLHSGPNEYTNYMIPENKVTVVRRGKDADPGLFSSDGKFTSKEAAKKQLTQQQNSRDAAGGKPTPWWKVSFWRSPSGPVYGERVYPIWVQANSSEEAIKLASSDFSNRDKDAIYTRSSHPPKRVSGKFQDGLRTGVRRT